MMNVLPGSDESLFATAALLKEGDAADRDLVILLRACAEASGRAFILVDGAETRLVAGEAILRRCHALLVSDGSAAREEPPDPRELLDVLTEREPRLAAARQGLDRDGETFEIRVRCPGGAISAAGRAVGAIALVVLTADPAVAETAPCGPADGATTWMVSQAMIEADPAPALLIANDGSRSVANPAWLAMSRGDPVGDRAAEGDARRAALALAAEAVASGGAVERLWRAGRGRPGSSLRMRAAPLPGGLAVVRARDVTDMEVAADALGRQRAAVEAVLAVVSDAVAIFDADRRLVFHNPAFARLWGLEPAWLAERPAHGVVLDRLRQRGRLPQTADYGRFRAGELARHERLSASPQAVWRVADQRILSVVSVPHPAGGLILMFSDITPEVRLKSQFNHLVQVQQATLDKLTDAVAVFGPDSRLKLHNEAFQRLWAMPADILAGQPDFDLIVDHCIARLHDRHFWGELKGRITDPDPGVRAAVNGEVGAADGRRLAWQSRPLPDGATLVSFVDVTDTRRLESALADREAALGAVEALGREFVGSVSHELRTPLTTILGYAELLEESDTALPEPARGWVGAVRAAASDLAALVEDILTFAEIDAGELSLDLKPTDVAALVGEAAERWRARAGKSGVALVADVQAGAGDFLADSSRLARVLDHLLGNALRSTPAGGRITLSARRAAGEVRLEVADTGRGIPFHVQARIFDRFRGEEGTGAGLGLALVKALVELHAGWVALESEPGHGAAFALHLPEAGQALA